MQHRNIDRRLAALEATTSPLARAEHKRLTGVPPEQWPDDELNAWCAVHCQDMEWLSDEQLEVIIAAPDEEAAGNLYQQFEEARYGAQS